jgi:hypothetical protein
VKEGFVLPICRYTRNRMHSPRVKVTYKKIEGHKYQSSEMLELQIGYRITAIVMIGFNVSEKLCEQLFDYATPHYPQKFAITSPTSGGGSVGIVRSRTKASEFFYFVCREDYVKKMTKRLIKFERLKTERKSTARCLRNRTGKVRMTLLILFSYFPYFSRTRRMIRRCGATGNT